MRPSGRVINLWSKRRREKPTPPTPGRKQRKAVTGKAIVGWGVWDGTLQEGNDSSPLVGKF